MTTVGLIHSSRSVSWGRTVPTAAPGREGSELLASAQKRRPNRVEFDCEALRSEDGVHGEITHIFILKGETDFCVIDRVIFLVRGEAGGRKEYSGRSRRDLL